MKTVTNTTSIKWAGKHGYAVSTDLFGEWQIPNTFEMASHKTGERKIFVLDTLAPGYEDGWDGEFQMFISEDDEIQMTISYP